MTTLFIMHHAMSIAIGIVIETTNERVIIVTRRTGKTAHLPTVESCAETAKAESTAEIHASDVIIVDDHDMYRDYIHFLDRGYGREEERERGDVRRSRSRSRSRDLPRCYGIVPASATLENTTT